MTKKFEFSVLLVTFSPFGLCIDVFASSHPLANGTIEPRSMWKVSFKEQIDSADLTFTPEMGAVLPYPPPPRRVVGSHWPYRFATPGP